VYPDPHVVQFIREHFVPVRVHVKQQPDAFKQLGERFAAQWTPTTLVIDDAGTERHRIEGFLPAHDFIGQLALGLGHSAFARGEFVEAESRFREVLERHADSDAGAEAQYWAGVARYKGTNDPGALEATAAAFRQRFQDSTWAKKASVWS
jgi:hypothetical protein